MNKLQSIAKVANYKLNVEEDASKAHTEGFIDGFNYCIKHINELLEVEKESIKGYNYMNERYLALKMYQERVNKALKELEEETF